MALNTRVQSLLNSLYDAVLAPNGFQAFTEAVRQEFQLKAVTMIIRHVRTQEIKSLWLCGLPSDWFERYILEYATEDLLAQHMMTSPMALFYASNLDIPNPERFMATRFFREWIVPQEVACAAGSILLQEGNWQTQIIVQRSPQHPPFSREELDQFNELVPHLQRAIQMRQRFAELQLGQNFLSSSLDVLTMPTLLFDELGRVAHKNKSAKDIFAKDKSLWIESGHVFTRDPATTRTLNLELFNAIRTSRGDGSELAGVVLLRRPGRQPLMLLTSPLRLTAEVQGAALLFVFDPENRPSITSELVRRLFGLSEAEAELALALCAGKTLDDAASERGTSIHTVKSQLKSIFNKTGTKRQTDLLSLLLASPAYFLAQSHVPDKDFP